MPANSDRDGRPASFWMSRAHRQQLTHLSSIFGRSRSEIVCILIEEVAAGRLKTKRLSMLPPLAVAAGTSRAGKPPA